MDDLISRQAAIDAVSSMFAPTPTQNDMVEDCLEIIEKLPSARTEQKHGKWIRLSNDLAQCSECKDYIDNAISCGYKFCPNCGARMEEGKDDE